MSAKLHNILALSATLALSMATGFAPARADAVNHPDHDGAGHGHTGADYGRPGDPGLVDRVIEITAVDNAFEPVSVTVLRGETIKFIISNQGQLPHELVLGSRSQQAEHVAQMSGMSDDEMSRHLQEEGNGITVQPGESRELTWTFSTDQDQIQFACHFPGHYDTGMFGSVIIREGG